MFPRKESTFLKLLLFTASFGKKKKMNDALQVLR